MRARFPVLNIALAAYNRTACFCSGLVRVMLEWVKRCTGMLASVRTGGLLLLPFVDSAVFFVFVHPTEV